jgi:hypothetical protein
VLGISGPSQSQAGDGSSPLGVREGKIRVAKGRLGRKVSSVRFDLSEDRDMRLDRPLMRQRVDYLGQAISRLGGEPLRIYPLSYFHRRP